MEPAIFEPAHGSEPSRATPPVATTDSGTQTQQLLRRLGSSAVLISLVVCTLFVFPIWVFAVIVIAFGGLALHEFFTMTRRRGILVHRPLSIGLGLVFMGLVAWRSLVQPGHIDAPLLGQNATMLNWAWDIFWPLTIVIIFMRQFTRQNTFEALSGLATTLFGLAYICGLLSYLFYLRAFKHENGALLIAFLMLVTKMGDVGAYVVGRSFGRHTLVPRISPRKTVEGLIGGLLMSGATAVCAAPMVQRLSGSPLAAVMVGLLLGLFGQLGDLAESLIKRDCQVKDSSGLFPGIGGVLDVVDSLLFTAPLFYGVMIYG